jgi:Xaa-Pro aminopeptidase
MPEPSSSTIQRRLSSVREVLRGAGLDVLLVTHPPNVRYLTGFSGSSGFVVVAPDTCVLSVDFRYATAARVLLDAHAGRDIALEVTDSSADAHMAALLQCRALAAAPDRDGLRVGIEAASMTVNRFNRLASALATGAPTPLVATRPAPVLVPTERVVERGRIVKDPAEIAILREAGRRLSGVARALPGIAVPGRSERDVAWEIDAAMRLAGFEAPAFQTIVASGPNSAHPHARPGSRILAGGEGVVLDFGGVYDGYCVDLTRTVQLGDPGTELRRIFRAVREAHGAAIAAVRPGALPSEIDGAARTVLGRHGLAEAFGHATGHGLGLEVHEEPRIGRHTGTGPEAPVEAGMVFTIEPGAYVADLGGVRIEDDVLVVDGGCELLTDVPVAW